METVVAEAQSSEWEQYRRLVLDSMRQAPDAYRRVLTDEAELHTDRWIGFLDEMAAQSDAAVLLSRSGGASTGLGFVRMDDGAVSIGGMWVDPESRGQGVGRALLEFAMEWGRSRAASRARLAVTVGNEAADQLYSSAGFVATGETEPLREGSDLMVVWMERPL